MVFSSDEASNKAVVYAAVPPSKDGIKVLEWLNAALAPLKGKGGGGKNGIAQGQVYVTCFCDLYSRNVKYVKL
jgi:alanyl-tRNA synthetase